MDIKTATVIPAECFIAINGEGYDGCNIPVPEGEHPHAAAGRHPQYGVIHAVQWFGDHGEYEHERGPAIGFSDVGVIDKFLPAWKRRRAHVLRSRHKAAVAEHGFAVEQLDDLAASRADTEKQIAEVEKTMSEATSEEHRVVLGQQLARARRTLDHVIRLHEHHSARHTQLAVTIPQMHARASQAEADLRGEAA